MIMCYGCTGGTDRVTGGVKMIGCGSSIGFGCAEVRIATGASDALVAVAAVFSLVAAVFWLSAPTVGVFPKKWPTMSKNNPPTVPAGNNLKYSSPPAMMSKARYAAYCATCGMVMTIV